jgi:hypothetical protein
MSKKSKTFEPVVEVEETQPVEEQQPTFIPSYPGEKGLDLDPATVARLEAERHAMLAGLHVPAQEPWRKPVEPAPVEEVIEVAEVIAPVEASELQAAKDTIEKLKQAHDDATRTAELTFQTQMSEALKTLGELQTRAARAIDAQAASRLRDAVTSMAESDVPGAVRAARGDAAQERQEKLMQRAAHALKSAAQTRVLLKQFDAQYAEQFNQLRAMDRDQFLLGTPNNGRAHAIYGDLRLGLDNIKTLRESLDGMLATDHVRIDVFSDGGSLIVGGYERGIQECFEYALRAWNAEQELKFVTCVKGLANANPDAVATLQLMGRGITDRVKMLRDMQNPANIAAPTYRPNPLAEPSKTRLAEMGGLPSVAVTGSPFQGGN